MHLASNLLNVPEQITAVLLCLSFPGISGAQAPGSHSRAVPQWKVCLWKGCEWVPGSWAHPQSWAAGPGCCCWTQGFSPAGESRPQTAKVFQKSPQPGLRTGRGVRTQDGGGGQVPCCRPTYGLWFQLPSRHQS